MAYLTAEELRQDLAGRSKRLESLLPSGAAEPEDLDRLCLTASAMLDSYLAAANYSVPVDTADSVAAASILRARAADLALVEISDGLDVMPDFIRAAQHRALDYLRDLRERKAHLPGVLRMTA